MLDCKRRLQIKFSQMGQGNGPFVVLPQIAKCLGHTKSFGDSLLTVMTAEADPAGIPICQNIFSSY